LSLFFTTKEMAEEQDLGWQWYMGPLSKIMVLSMYIVKWGMGHIQNIFAEATGTAERSEDAVILSPLGGTETILLVEDDRALRILVVTVLDKYGYTVIEAIDGDDALARFDEHKESITLLITDVVMPKRSGIEVFER